MKFRRGIKNKGTMNFGRRNTSYQAKKKMNIYNAPKTSKLKQIIFVRLLQTVAGNKLNVLTFFQLLEFEMKTCENDG